MKIFQILHNFCYWQTPFKSLEETRNFPPDCIFVEAPDYVTEQWGYDETKEGDERFIRPVPPDGWIYDEETGEYFPEGEIINRLVNNQNLKQEENKSRFAEFLKNHPLTYTDGKQYGVTMEDQNEIQLNISQYQIQVQCGIENPVLEWHSIHEACTRWTIEDLTQLVLAIRNYIYPWFEKFNTYKAMIYAATTVKEVREINLEYKTDEEKESEDGKDSIETE